VDAPFALLPLVSNVFGGIDVHESYVPPFHENIIDEEEVRSCVPSCPLSLP
jgi:hypothetical protein